MDRPLASQRSTSRPLVRCTAACALAWACAGSPAAQDGQAVAMAADEASAMAANAATAARSPHLPTRAFAQLGLAREATAETFGATWDLRSATLRTGWSLRLEASISRWENRSSDPSDHGVLTQLGIVPVFRYAFAEGASPWFFDGGIGATVTSSIYRSGGKRFSTAFNFGDHVGLGYAFGEGRRHEISLRVEHFSNGGIRHPNPGQNFLQLRFQRAIG